MHEDERRLAVVVVPGDALARLKPLLSIQTSRACIVFADLEFDPGRAVDGQPGDRAAEESAADAVALCVWVDGEILDMADIAAGVRRRIGDDVADDGVTDDGNQKVGLAEEFLEGGVGPRLVEDLFFDPVDREQVGPGCLPDGGCVGSRLRTGCHNIRYAVSREKSEGLTRPASPRAATADR